MHPTQDATTRIDAFLAQHAPATPCLVLDLETVRQRYRALRDALPEARVHYAVKANPAAAVIAALAEQGAGRYNGLAETQNEAIHYPIRTPRRDGPDEAVVLAGPTCDSTDVIFDRTTTPLPLALRIGDYVDFLTAGAYTASYAPVEFNGFPPIQTYCI